MKSFTPALSIWIFVPVEFTFASLHLREILENRKRAKSALGQEAAFDLERRVADLAACSNLDEFENLFPGSLIDRSPDERAIRLDSGYQIIVRAGHVQVPRNSSNGTDWPRVSRVKVMALEQPK